MKRPQTKKLRLTKERLRSLTPKDLRGVNGGGRKGADDTGEGDTRNPFSATCRSQ